MIPFGTYQNQQINLESVEESGCSQESPAIKRSNISLDESSKDEEKKEKNQRKLKNLIKQYA